MKSISIVYKKSRKDLSEAKFNCRPARKSIDEYYSKLTQKQMKKQQLFQKLRTQTARAAKIRDKARVFSSLNIHSIGTPKVPEGTIQTQRQEQQIYPKLKKFVNRKIENNFFTLKIPDHNQNNVVQEIKIRNRDISKHSKLKVLGKIKNLKQTTIVISIDFILNQQTFWDQQTIQDNAAKTWKTLMPLANIIWLVKRQNSARKLLTFARQSKLRLDGIVQVDCAKKQTLNLSFYNLEKELKLEKQSKLLIINGFKAGMKNLSEIEFKNSLPIVSHGKTYIHYVRIEMNEKNRFSTVLKVLARQLPQPTNINHLFQQFDNKRDNGVKRRLLQLNEEKYSSEQVLQDMERMKLNMCHEFNQRIGLTTKIEGDSVQFLIGDMLKRNYKFFMEFYSRRSPKKIRSLSKISKKGIFQTTYNRPIYMWNF